MYNNRESSKPGARSLGQLRGARLAGSLLRLPQITIRGDNNLINLGRSGGVNVNTAGAVDSGWQPARYGQQWPQQILDAIRRKAARTRRSNNDVCELAARVLGRAVVTLERLSARELARVYEALCASEHRV
jgi:hypothetical protein